MSDDPLEKILLNDENVLETPEMEFETEVIYNEMGGQPEFRVKMKPDTLGEPVPRKEDPKFELKPLPKNLKYAYLDEKNIYPVIISANLLAHKEEKILGVLRKHCSAIGYALDDFKGIHPSFCRHHIHMEEDAKLVVDAQCCLNPMMKEVVRLLEARIIYHIFDSKWVSHVHCLPKKGGFTIVTNKDNELNPRHLITGYRMCIDYRKLNKATRKYHYSLPFIDQMLERLAKHTHFCY